MKKTLSLVVSLLAMLSLALVAARASLARALEPPSVEAALQAPAGTYALLIIAPGEFEPALDPLVAHKNATGITTTLVTLESIYGDARFVGVDEPEQIKQTIAYYEGHYGIQYAMLAGDVDKLPVRWVTSRRSNHPEEVEYYFPSDLYYADLYDSGGAFNTWDYDGDGYFGEHVVSGNCAADPYSVNLDHADLHPDVAVGRVPASTAAEMESYVAKVIKYEHLTFDPADDWFHDALFIAGSGRKCDAGIHFNDVQSTLGGDFDFQTYIHDSYLTASPDQAYRPCFCTGTETTAECRARTGLSADEIDIFEDAMWGSTTWDKDHAVPAAEFAAVGLLGWHDHTSRVRNYTTDVNNADKFTVAFSDGCSDGGFAGGPPGGMARFAPVSEGTRNVGGQDMPYLTVDGDEIQVIFDPEWVDHDGDGTDDKFYHVTGCVLNGTTYPRSGDHCGGGILPDMTLADGFEGGSDPVAMTRPYILNAPPPAPLQPAAYDWEFNPEEKLFAKNSASGDETGWVGLAAATKGASFPANGELMYQFFRGYNSPHSSVDGRNRLGDMWRSMLMRWLDNEVFDASGDFSFAPIFSDYDISRNDWFETYCAMYGMQHTMMYALFGDPSLRAGGVEGLADTTPPTTSDNADNDWHNDGVSVALTASDAGTPPSGVRETRYRIGGGAWRTGNRLTVSAPDDHSNDGIHTFNYYSMDFLGNTETTKSDQVRIDTVKPDTDIALDGEPPAMVFCFPGQSCPEQGCYNDEVTVALTATDGRSGVASTWYEMGGYIHTYTGPFDVHGGDYLDFRTLHYWSEDEAGNVEGRHEVDFCVSNWRAGMLRDEIRILAALKDIVAMRMRPEFAATLPIEAVQFYYARQGVAQPYWTLIGTDTNIKDGWGVDWDTRQLQTDGGYIVRMMALDAPPTLGTRALQPSAVLYQEQVSVTVSNVPSASYEFNLSAFPTEASRGEEIEYTLEFINQMGYPLTNLTMTCSIDTGLFDQIGMMDGGGLDAYGNPTWSTAQVGAGATWKGHFTATTKADLTPGTVIASQAFLTNDLIHLALSDDPTTPAAGDWTKVQIKLLNGVIVGKVREATYSQPVSATVTIAGPASQTLATGLTGVYTSTPLTPGIYTVSVQAEDYEYLVPAGPVTVTLDGTAASVHADFMLNMADIIPPVSTIYLSADQIVLSHTAIISGTAYDYAPGSGVSQVEVSILRSDHEQYWDGAAWVVTPTWLLAAGATTWTLDCSGIAWDERAPYAIASRATDGAGNVELPLAASTTPRLQAPALISPLDGAQVDKPTFVWSSVLDSQYHIQADDDDDFGSPEIDDVYLDLSTRTGRQLAGGVYYWRVKAINREYGYPESEWSAVWRVTVTAKIYLPLVLREFAD